MARAKKKNASAPAAAPEPAVQPTGTPAVPNVPAGELELLTTVTKLIDAGWNHTHTAPNGNALYTYHHPVHGHKYAEVDNTGKVVDIRSSQYPVPSANAQSVPVPEPPTNA